MIYITSYYIYICIMKCNCWVTGHLCSLQMKSSNNFQSACTNLLSPAVHESSSYSISSPTLGIVWLLIFGHFAGCVMVSYCGLNLHFSNNNVEQTMEYLFKSFAHFSIRLLIFLFIDFEKYLYTKNMILCPNMYYD